VDSGGRRDEFKFGAEKRGEEICRKKRNFSYI